MGENEGRGQPSGILPNGLLPGDVTSVIRVLDGGRWMEAEERTSELILCIQPNERSEVRRNAVANYVKQLITNCLGCKVFTFGSVPLKTYLPDGDIDLTAFSNNESLKDTWANTVRDVLEKEEKSENAEFRVKEVQYIQAEVKLVKCLVENIVVDISFNQLGGLCTLCFLEETDKLVNQNHLFKRSIILIKAWCYYESRILGAHHGLISTYALETLVLYIFHVFNNKFTGPLEVLYRFLEFFSNFDWDRFCISLWGPIPISSLPDMTSEPSRKDKGKVLLSKIFLDSMTQKYAAPPGGQENHGQPFVSKHFNVVDPLRPNNNLGRSVSKGNFYRIRSAFAFGAKKLTKLLESPKEDIIAEVNQFFTNTWERHRTGNRPDVANFHLRHLSALKAVQTEDTHNTKYTNTKRKTENLSLGSGHEHLEGTSPDLQDTVSEFFNDFSQHAASHPSATSHTHSQKSQNFQSISRIPDQTDRNDISSGLIHDDKCHKTLVYTHPLNDQRQGRYQFPRTRSSPELTGASFGLSRVRSNRALESTRNQYPHANSDFNSRGILGPEIAGSNNMKSSINGPVSTRHMSSLNSDFSSDPNNISNSYHNDIGFVKMEEELVSVSETLDMQQEEQDLVNMMGSCGLHGFNGPVPLHLPSPHLPLAFSHVPSPMGFAQRNLVGFLSSNFSVIGSSWESSMQIRQGLVPSSLPQYVNFANLNSGPDGMTNPVDEGSGTIQRNSEENCGIWHENISRGSNWNINSSQKIHVDVKQPKSHSGLSSIPSHQGNNASVALSRGNNFGKEDRGAAEDNKDLLQNQANKETDNDSSLWGASTKFLPFSQVNSRSKSASENLRDASTSKAPKLTKEKRGRKQAPAPVITSLQGKGNSTLQFESSSGPVSSEIEVLNLTTLTNPGTLMPERVSGAPSLSQRLPGFESVAQVPGSNPLIPMGPMLVGTSRQRRVENSNVLPVTFVPTGPPVPFFYYPMYNFTSTTGNTEESANQFDIEEVDKFGAKSSDQNADLIENVDHLGALVNSATTRSSAPESSDDHEHKPDIFNSDIASHLADLAYGRSCQNLGYPGPLMYSTPVHMPQMYLQGHHPWDGQGRPNPSNLNFTHIMGYGSRGVPVMPLYPGPDRSSSMFLSYGDEAPRYRGGTGTYLPNPKASFRERQSSSRNHRGYGYDRNGHGDREGSWISLKQQRASGRNHGRNQAERGSMRNDRQTTCEKQEERFWESYQHEPVSSYSIHNSSIGSNNCLHNSANVAGIYAEAPPSSNGMNPTHPVAPPVMMVYSYNQGVGYAPSADSLEFGSLGPLHLANEASRTYEQSRRTYRRGSPRSSPDQPSSPHLKR